MSFLSNLLGNPSKVMNVSNPEPYYPQGPSIPYQYNQMGNANPSNNNPQGQGVPYHNNHMMMPLEMQPHFSPMSITQALAQSSNELGSVFPSDKAVTSLYPTVRHELEIPLMERAQFGSTIEISLDRLQKAQAEQSEPWYCPKIVLYFSLPAIRNRKEPCIKEFEVCSRGCKDKVTCYQKRHKPELHEPVTWVDSIAHYLTHQLTLKCGTTVPQRIYWHIQELMDDRYVNRSRNTDQEVGRYYTEEDRMRGCRKPVNIRATLMLVPFQQPALGLPLYALYNSPLSMSLELPALEQCWFANDAKTPYLLHQERKVNVHDIKLRVFAEVWPSHDPDIMHIMDLRRQARLNGQASYLPFKSLTYYWPYWEAHKGQLNNSPEVQKNTKQPDDDLHSINLDLQGEILEILWLIQWDHHEKQKEWFNFGGFEDDDPITEAELNLDNKVNLPRRSAEYFRTNTHTIYNNKPHHFVYGWSWSIDPDRCDLNPGSFMLKPAANQSTCPLQIRVKLQNYIHKCRWYVFIRRPNRVVIQNGEMKVDHNVPKQKEQKQNS
ncbi:MAG: hypothetical protein Sylvanvirus36_2 [Sylvanvirus sp.]|uniref:Uncharacterized protein n=1 Tax=Sylvanvirus sp. TaxID=2487774 RepID=A0A3G5ALK3_9VIRU|nr:MAG: hypothetical protein Sylvanvirus36_2 [Sylvanvirus sp.]